jgi:hypothetical protein
MKLFLFDIYFNKIKIIIINIYNIYNKMFYMFFLKIIIFCYIKRLYYKYYIIFEFLILKNIKNNILMRYIIIIVLLN